MIGWRRAAAVGTMAVVLGGGAASAERIWTRDEVLEAADQALEELGRDPQAMAVAFDIHNTVWQEHTTTLAGVRQLGALGPRLRGRRYFAVRFMPFDGADGDVWVFVDRETGRVLATLGGEE
ncbi:MAG TPA: hypothetical protein VGB20_06280 [bacterium]